MKFTEYQYEIGSYFLSALINGDESGLTGDESAAFANWLPHSGPGFWTTGEENEFGTCDITGLRGSTTHVSYFKPVSEIG